MIKAERVEIVTHSTVPQSFTVEAIDTDGDGGIDMTTFSGPNAKERAHEYAAWKYQPAHSAKAA
jgi:hypothetical protein